MALSYNDFSGDGSSTDFNVTFPFISRDHVHVTLDEVETGSFTWLSDSQIRFNSAPGLDVAIRIKRVTPNSARLVDFANGSTLDAEADLDTDSNQLFYIIQEALDGTVSLASTTSQPNLAILTDSFTDGVEFTAGSTTSLGLSQAPGSKDNTFVTFDGVVQHKNTYSVSGSTITFTSAIPVGVGAVDIVSFPSREFFYSTLANGSVGTLSLADNVVTTAKIQDSQVTDAKLATDSVTTAKIADGSVTLDKLDPTALAALLPIGVMMPYGGSSAPTGWLLCDGSAVSRTTYADLFALLGTTYGAGNGSTTFNLPDQRGRCAIGAGAGSGLTSRARGWTGGEETHTLTTAEIPAHTHTYYRSDSNHSGIGAGGSADGSNTNTGSTGGGGAHNNMQPSLAHTFIIKVV